MRAGWYFRVCRLVYFEGVIVRSAPRLIRDGAKRWLVWTLVGLLAGCGDPGYQRHGGSAMGTGYRVTAKCPGEVGDQVTAVLDAVNADMSTYLPESTLSVFNRGPVGEWLPVSADLIEVVEAAHDLSELSGGAFDVTVGPLVNLWGFGPNGAPAQRPAAARVEFVRAKVGYHYLESRRAPPALRKSTDVYVDLSAIAKGFAVDRIAQRLFELECSDFLVDVGGEVRASGVNPQGAAWRIGVEVPDPDSFGAIQRVLRISGSGLATSGDYRNFLEVDGERFAHTIDPRTGYPVDHTLASVTVVHESAMLADGYATLLNVLGPQEGFSLAEGLGLPVLFLIRTPNGFEERYTVGLEQFLGQTDY
jgi:thiamine biosynthesis lipoprotein